MPRPKTFIPPSKAVLRTMYNVKTDKEIALVYGCTDSVIKQWRRKLHIRGIRRRGEGIGAPRRYERPSKERLRSLTELNTDEEISAMYGCTRTAVRKWRRAYGLQKNGVVYRRMPWAYDLDEDFFEKIDTEQKAYILGMLATDGCVSKNRIFLSLQARDEHILQDILQAMRSASPIHDRPKGSFPGSGPMKYIALTSRKLVSDLAKRGIVPRKSLTLTYTKVGRRFERHYIRGLFDGDGSIHARAGFYFLGTEALIDGVVDAIHRHTGVRLSKKKAVRLYRANGYGGSVKVLRWMYRGATIFLHRKKQSYDEHWA